MANLQLKTVSKLYPSGALALYKANLRLKDSEFIAVVGGEKCGKSTLLRVIAGVEEATEGAVYIGDKDVTKTDTRDRDVAMIFQGSTLYPSINVFENMAYGLKLRKASSALVDQRVKAAADILGLSDLLARKPKMLTTEQKQLVAFGRAIVREPKLYLLDDPLAGISAEIRPKLRSVLINLQMRLKGTFIYATKNVNEALTMATRIIVLREGFIQQIDTPANLYDYPANAYVAFTIGSPTVNFINGAKIVKGKDGYRAEADGVSLPLPENIVERFAAIDEYAEGGKPVILGIRPEDLTVSEQGEIKVSVTDVEEICGTEYAECTCGKLYLTACAQGVRKGSESCVSADMSHALVFDAETRLTLLNRDEGYEVTDCPDADFKPLAYGEEEHLKNKLKLPSQKDKKKKK